MIKSVLFDFDGTIADTLPLVVSSLQKALYPIYKRRLSYEEIAKTFGPCEEGSIKLLAPDNFEETMALFYDYYQQDDIDCNCVKAFSGIKNLINKLKQRGLIVGLVTGKGEFTTKNSLDKYGLKDIFDVIKTGSIEKSIKCECILEVIEQYKLKPQEVYYVGDMPSDIDAARKAGCKIISVLYADIRNETVIREKAPDAICYSVGELEAFLCK